MKKQNNVILNKKELINYLEKIIKLMPKEKSLTEKLQFDINFLNSKKNYEVLGFPISEINGFPLFGPYEEESSKYKNKLQNIMLSKKGIEYLIDTELNENQIREIFENNREINSNYYTIIDAKDNNQYVFWNKEHSNNNFDCLMRYSNQEGFIFHFDNNSTNSENQKLIKTVQEDLNLLNELFKNKPEKQNNVVKSFLETTILCYKNNFENSIINANIVCQYYQYLYEYARIIESEEHKKYLTSEFFINLNNKKEEAKKAHPLLYEISLTEEFKTIIIGGEN